MLRAIVNASDFSDPGEQERPTAWLYESVVVGASIFLAEAACIVETKEGPTYSHKP